MKKKMLLILFILSLTLLMVTPVFAAPAHQSGAADLKGGVADLVPGHVARAHQAAAADLKGDVADLVPEHFGR